MGIRRQAKVIAVVNQKGGCTKTATTMQLAGAIAQTGLRVGVIDMDPQSTATLWAMQAKLNRPRFPADVVPLAPLKELFLDRLEGLLESYDVVLIDCPPAVESNVPWAALLVADLAIIPVVPVMDNVWASKLAEELVLKAREERVKEGQARPLQGAYVLQQQRRGTVFEVCEEVLRKRATLPILKSTIALRNIYPESQLMGTHVTAMGKSPAAMETLALKDEILSLLKIKQPRKVSR
jgi:chromosome partitioning protein